MPSSTGTIKRLVQEKGFGFIEIGTEKNTTIVFPLPLDLLGSLSSAFGGRRAEPRPVALPATS